MRATRHPPYKQIQFDHSLHQQTLEQVHSAKYLKITITDNSDWSQHISEISAKTTKTMGFIRRNLADAPRQTKGFAYKTFALSLGMQHETQIGQVWKVQMTTARWTCRRWRNTSSVGDMLDELEWPSLETRREQSSLAFTIRFSPVHCLLIKISTGLRLQT